MKNAIVEKGGDVGRVGEVGRVVSLWSAAICVM
jgi:hypothetical protein